MIPKFGGECKLMYIDTDSFIYEKQCKDALERKCNLIIFGTSDYQAVNCLNISMFNEKV